MAYTSQPTAPGAGQPLADAFVQTMLDNIAYLKSEVDALRGLSLRQRIVTSKTDDVITSTSFVDVTSLSTSITTTGGRVRAYLEGSTVDGETSQIYLAGPGTGLLEGMMRAVFGADNSGTQLVNADNADGIELYSVPIAFSWEATPLAGTLTIKVQARKTSASTTTSLGFTKIALVVEEWGT